MRIRNAFVYLTDPTIDMFAYQTGVSEREQTNKKKTESLKSSNAIRKNRNKMFYNRVNH